jgi:4-amino-4-deoxy-L-arabinose transferase-like glycosyltransferase
MKREFSILLGGWLVLAALLLGLGRQNLSAPGLFYDEAIYGGLAKDFLAGHPTGSHMPGTSTMEIFGGPLPIFVQPYLGALKCWLLIPGFKLFGSTLAVLRGANLFFSAAALLIFMLWTWRLLGLAEALLAGLLLAVDPAFFFLGVLDWGSLLPSLLCRFGGFFLALLAWRRQHAGWALAAGFVFGLGFFNKIDFGVILAGTALAALCAGGKSIAAEVRARAKIILPALLGFLAGAGPVLALFRVILRAVFSPNAPHNPGEFAEKLNTLRAMYDGSYFYRLMDAGGLFDKMYLTPSPVWTPFGIAVLFAALVLLADLIFFARENPVRPAKMFILLSAGFVTLGALVLPGAVRIHHTTMVYPFPHLLIASACVAVWQPRWRPFLFHRTAGTLVILLAGALVVCNFNAVRRTQQLIRQTGGRGWWSNALEKFAGENKTRSDVTISSLDWGFNEQLEFLTSGPALEEPFWQFAFGQNPDLPRDPQHLYLVHPPEFSLSPLGAQFTATIARENTNAVVQPWRDGQGKIVFYSVTFTTR